MTVELWSKTPTSISLEKHEASWLAALIDGEGTIGVYKGVRAENRSGFKYRPIIMIYNSHLPLMQHIASLLPGWLSLHNKGRAASQKHKLLYKFMVSSKHHVDLVDAILPFLIVKAEQARIVRQMCCLMHSGSNRESATNHEVYENMYLQTRALNQRGTGEI